MARHRAAEQRRGGQREAAALAGAADRDPVAVDAVQAGRGLDCQHGIRVKPGVVIAIGTGDAAGHHRRVLRARPDVAGRADGPPAALTAGVHHEHREAGRREHGVIGWQAAAAAVADELHHHRQRLVAGSGRPQVPGADPVTAGAGELHVVRLHRPVHVRPVPGDRGRPCGRLGLSQPMRPPFVQPGGLLGVRAVLKQLLRRQVEPRHVITLPGLLAPAADLAGFPGQPCDASCCPGCQMSSAGYILTMRGRSTRVATSADRRSRVQSAR